MVPEGFLIKWLLFLEHLIRFSRKGWINKMNVNGRDYDYELYVLTPASREIGRGFCYSLSDFNILWNVVNEGAFDFNVVLGLRLFSEA